MDIFEYQIDKMNEFLEWWNSEFNQENGYPECIVCEYPVLTPSMAGWEVCPECDAGVKKSTQNKEFSWRGRKKSPVQSLKKADRLRFKMKTGPNRAPLI